MDVPVVKVVHASSAVQVLPLEEAALHSLFGLVFDLVEAQRVFLAEVVPAFRSRSDRMVGLKHPQASELLEVLDPGGREPASELDGPGRDLQQRVVDVRPSRRIKNV